MDFKLTQYSHGAGCGCKISPKILDEILKNQHEKRFYSTLLVGNEERDDAAVMDLGDGTAIISTTDFLCQLLTMPLILVELPLSTPFLISMLWVESL